MMKSRFDVLYEDIMGTARAIGKVAGMAAGVVPIIPGNTNIPVALSNVKNQMFGGNAPKSASSAASSETPTGTSNTVFDKTRIDKIAKGYVKARTPMFDKAPIQQGIANLVTAYQRAKPNATVQEVQAHINAILNGVA